MFLLQRYTLTIELYFVVASCNETLLVFQIIKVVQELSYNLILSINDILFIKVALCILE